MSVNPNGGDVRTRIILCAALVAAMTAGAAWAHDGHVHRIMGTVMGRDAKTIQVKTPGGETLSIAVNEKTVVARGKQKVTLTDVQKGIRVVVDIGNGEDPLIAREILVGATKLPKDDDSAN
jgi:hypothetical protein